jgi:hypothetical protein
VAVIGFAAFKVFGSKSPNNGPLNAKQEAMRQSQIKAMQSPDHPDLRRATRDNPPPTSGGGK